MWETWSELIKKMPAGAFLQALSLPISILVSWLAIRFTTNNQRDILVAQQICKLLDDISEAAKALRGQYEEHYKGEYADGFSISSVKRAQQKIQAQTRNIELKREVLNAYLSKKPKRKLQNALDSWLNSIEADSFPVYRKADVFGENDPHFDRMHTAQVAFEGVLATCKKDILQRRFF